MKDEFKDVDDDEAELEEEEEEEEEEDDDDDMSSSDPDVGNPETNMAEEACKDISCFTASLVLPLATVSMYLPMNTIGINMPEVSKKVCGSYAGRMTV